MAGLIHPVILSGGSGTRLWPLSRRDHPKQFLPLVSERSMLEETALRFTDSASFAPPMIVCGIGQKSSVIEHLNRVGSKPARIVLEPSARGTAPAATVAALLQAETAPESLLLVLPADHFVGDLAALHAAISSGTPAAQAGKLVALGIKPDCPETGYGYIRPGTPLPACEGCFTVDSFVEKPDLATAERFVSSGTHLWNGGIFLFRADRLLSEMDIHMPAVPAGCRAALKDSTSDTLLLELDSSAFATCPTISIDRAVMERTDKGAVVPVDMAWSDIGSWEALWRSRPHDTDGNVTMGPALSVDTSNSYLRSEGPLVATIGLDGYVVIASNDAVLVCPMERVQEVSELANRLQNRREPTTE